ncbi:putative CDC31-spindle pole body component, centrin [Protomyces lactucae-debilis]|uniref:Putative CDC31-spindle pole body component, centrin n=1 Tax=Protomyces lactucae-debilis TaxID=2754530 RepID=A0A1Y2F7M6_PROLT|nr:putative CDC31-spindle pole body component, centrin [Protomyces lactucae-debilis]ORY79930.1 putative CDC31-spindle pole body component, centrin [Protomyces lactucae-debilis]
MLSPSTTPARTSYGHHNTTQDPSQHAGFGNHARDVLNPEQLKEIDDAFSMFDVNQDDLLDFHECRVAMRALGFDVPKSEILKLMRDAQPGASTGGGVTKGSGGGGSPAPLIRRELFTRVMSEKMLKRDPMEEIRRAFVLFAGGEDQKIDLDKLARVASELNESIDPSELQAMIEEFDLDDDGEISLDEFIAIMRED